MNAIQIDLPHRAALRTALLQRQELADIGLALQRLDHDDYGVCSDCGVDIPFARLQARPQALRCIACEEALEMRQHHAVP